MTETEPAGVTPVMAQYLEIKAAHPDALLFYRMGDFYELFFEDAEAASAALGITLTKRGRHLGRDIPMCGVPVVSAEGYLLTLIRRGFRIAICEQVEDPAEARRRGAKAVVRREVVRVVTPGTLTEESLLEPRAPNRLAALAEVRGEGALAWVDISTGALAVAPVTAGALPALLARLSPREVLVPEGLAPSAQAAAGEAGAALTVLPSAGFDSGAAEARLRRVWNVATLDGFGRFGRAELAALGGLVGYVDLTQKGRLPLLRPPVREETTATLQMDAATRRNLEIVRGPGGGREGSLLAAIDRTVTGPGARLLEARLSGPATDPGLLRRRHDAVAALVADRALADRLHDLLRRVPDIERALTRLSLGRGGPRDLAAIRDGLGQAGALAALLAGDLPEMLATARAALLGHEALVASLDAALVAEPPPQVRDGGLVAPGHHAELDACRRLAEEGRGVIGALQAEYQRATGIASLRIRHNNVLGYFVETTATQAAKLAAPPHAATFVHRQTTANQVRFTTLDLATLETRILNAGARALEIEAEVFAGLSEAVLAEAGAVARAAEALAEIDLAAAFARLAADGTWVRPRLGPGREFRIRGGRHPVVEAARRAAGETPFVANDCDLGDRPVWLVTGPNMGGKSTFLRQNALIALLAQAGSFVPAEEAEIGIVTQLFSRVGAADDLARGRSTFMVEMVETAAILNQAGEGALVILDEIGRGTATYDGLSIAWAVVEHLHDVNRCRVLFATHYHELTALAARLPGLHNATLSVREWQGEVIFLHEVRPGAADRSYGVQVARLAGLPAAVTDRARAVLEALEGAERERGGKSRALVDDLPLFRAAPSAPPIPATRSSAVEERLQAVEPDALSPREALDLVYALKALLRGEP